jgi:regulator of replication initiation timing
MLEDNVRELQGQLAEAYKKIDDLIQKNAKLEVEIDRLSIDLAFYKDEIGGFGA